jgi:hypothetical protein
VTGHEDSLLRHSTVRDRLDLIVPEADQRTAKQGIPDKKKGDIGADVLYRKGGPANRTEGA